MFPSLNGTARACTANAMSSRSASARPAGAAWTAASSAPLGVTAEASVLWTAPASAADGSKAGPASTPSTTLFQGRSTRTTAGAPTTAPPASATAEVYVWAASAFASTDTRAKNARPISSARAKASAPTTASTAETACAPASPGLRVHYAALWSDVGTTAFAAVTASATNGPPSASAKAPGTARRAERKCTAQPTATGTGSALGGPTSGASATAPRGPAPLVGWPPTARALTRATATESVTTTPGSAVARRDGQARRAERLCSPRSAPSASTESACTAP